MSATIQTRFGAAIVAIAPAVLLAGLVYHPYIPFVPDPAAVAAAAASDTTRWGIAHLVVGVGSGFAVLAFLAVQSYLRAAGTEGLSDLTFPFIVIGSTGNGHRGAVAAGIRNVEAHGSAIGGTTATAADELTLSDQRGGHQDPQFES